MRRKYLEGPAGWGGFNLLVLDACLAVMAIAEKDHGRTASRLVFGFDN